MISFTPFIKYYQPNSGGFINIVLTYNTGNRIPITFNVESDIDKNITVFNILPIANPTRNADDTVFVYTFEKVTTGSTSSVTTEGNITLLIKGDVVDVSQRYNNGGISDTVTVDIKEISDITYKL